MREAGVLVIDAGVLVREIVVCPTPPCRSCLPHPRVFVFPPPPPYPCPPAMQVSSCPDNNNPPPRCCSSQPPTTKTPHPYLSARSHWLRTGPDRLDVTKECLLESEVQGKRIDLCCSVTVNCSLDFAFSLSCSLSLSLSLFLFLCLCLCLQVRALRLNRNKNSGSCRPHTRGVELRKASPSLRHTLRTVAQEKHFKANTVEVAACSKCGGQTRFPR